MCHTETLAGVVSACSTSQSAVLPVVSATICAGIVCSVQAAGVTLTVGGEVESEARGDGVALGRAASFAVVGEGGGGSVPLALAFNADVQRGFWRGGGARRRAVLPAVPASVADASVVRSVQAAGVTFVLGGEVERDACIVHNTK